MIEFKHLTDIEIIEQLAIMEARESFWAYRQYMNPKMIIGWWQQEISEELQNFYEDLISGKRPQLIIQAPPQHGKSSIITDFVSWVSGKQPDIKSIFASFSDRLGIRTNLKLKRLYMSHKYQKIFPDLRIKKGSYSKVNDSLYQINRNQIDHVDREGSFRNTTVRGSITGESLDLGLIDDPIKGREEAGSSTVRERTWEWFTDDFFTRFSEYAGMLWVLTRWHVDDPAGRLIEKDSSVKVISYPAIATRDEKNRKKGEALFPKHKSLEFLLKRKKMLPSFSWEALYQQNPIKVGGEIFKGEWFKYYKLLPQIEYRYIYVDTAQKTKEANDYSVFEVWGKGVDGNIYLIDLLRGKWDAVDLERNAIQIWNKHNKGDPKAPGLTDPKLGKLRGMKIEDKVSGTSLIQRLTKLSKIPVIAIQRNTDKYLRACDGLPVIESGFVYLPADASFTSDFVKECESFTADDSHAYDDQVDPMLDAIEDMISNRKVSFYD